VKLIKEITKESVKILNSGGVILYPTDTVWGLGSLIDKEAAVNKIYTIKNRPRESSFVLLVNSVEMLKNYTDEIPTKAFKLIKHYYKPITIVYKKVKNVPEWILNGNKTVAIRVVKNAFCEGLIAASKQALVSTSANAHGSKTPQTYFDIEDDIKNGVDYIVPASVEVPNEYKSSKIIGFTEGNELEVIRE